MYLTKNKIGGLALLASALLSLCSCSDDAEVNATEPVFAITSVPTFVFPAEDAPTQTFSFTVNNEWRILSDAQWVTFSQKRGESGQITIELTAADNPTYAERTSSFYLMSGERKREIALTQAANVPLGINISNADALTAESLSKNGGLFTINFSLKNVDSWDVDFSYEGSSTGWLSVSSRDEEGAVEIKYEANTVPIDRSASIKISGGSYSDQLNITQAANPVITLDGTKSLADILDYYGIRETLASIELSGPVSDDDWALLKTLAGTTLKEINLANITNTVLPNSQFINCTALENLTLPTHGQLEIIPMELCRNASNLQGIVIPEGVRIIDRHAFANCSQMGAIYLPSTLEYMYGYCFEGQGTNRPAIHIQCQPLQILETMRGQDTKSTKASVFNNNSLPAECALYVNEKYLDMYKGNFTLDDLGIDESWEFYPDWELGERHFKWSYAEIYTE
ncbi:MAG: leucine-rich repeat protein [Bacteroidales bacterium]|nr:leucine-rich repeat protein [Bacteroidales bacterium]